MSVMLFREGSETEFKGVPCKVMHCDVSEIQHYLDRGWVADINDIKKSRPDVKGEYTNREIRLIAKAEGIQGWEDKRIQTLMAEMKAKRNATAS